MRLLDALVPSRSLYGLPESVLGYGLGGLNGITTFSVGGNTYTVPVNTTMPGSKAEPIGNSFEGYALGALMSNSVVFALSSARMRVFAEARFQFQQLQTGRPGDLFGTKALGLLEKPWPGGTTGDLLALMLLHADFAGNAYVTPINGQLVAMRPDWVDIVLAGRDYVDIRGHAGTVGMEKVGFLYYEGGRGQNSNPMMFLADEVAHFAPQPDPLAHYRGMSWLTPVIREVMADGAMTTHKLKYFENAATPNLAVSLSKDVSTEQFEKFVEKMKDAHEGVENAYRTLYTAGGADVTVIGSTMETFTDVQGKGETRIAMAAGVPPSVAGLSEAMQGATLNDGNFSAARRQFADTTLSTLWRNVCGSLQLLLEPVPNLTRLWYDIRDVPFLREDQKDIAAIQLSQTQAIRELYMAGFIPESIIPAVMGSDYSLLKHTGLPSIQVQPPAPPAPPEPPALPAAPNPAVAAPPAA